MFIYNFTKYINWPVNSGDFVINVLGNDGITKEIEYIAAKKMVGNSKISIKKILSPSEIKNCQILFIASSKMDFLSEIYLIARKNMMACFAE